MHVKKAQPVEELLVGADKVLGFGTDETIMITKDGKSWDGKKGTFVGGKGIWDGRKYVTAYEDKIYTSQDGLLWKRVYKCKNVAAPRLGQVTYNGIHYIATGTVDGKNSKRDWIYRCWEQNLFSTDYRCCQWNWWFQ